MHLQEGVRHQLCRSSACGAKAMQHTLIGGRELPSNRLSLMAADDMSGKICSILNTDHQAFLPELNESVASLGYDFLQAATECTDLNTNRTSHFCIR